MQNLTGFKSQITVREIKKHQDTLGVLAALKEAGKVRVLGVSVKSPVDAFSLLDLFPFQSVQANFNMLDIRVIESKLMERLGSVGASLVARTPMAFGYLSGALTGKEIFPKEDHRSRWTPEQVQLWVSGAHDLHDCCKESSINPKYQTALRFCLSYSQVATTIVGMLTSEEVLANVCASAIGPLSKQSCFAIEEIHKKRNFVVS